VSKASNVPPGHNQLEISVFGVGVGECVVVHLGDGDWMVVDSFLNRHTGNPVALDYLKALDVDPSRNLKRLVITHWHNDHTRGASAILTTAPVAKTWASVALQQQNFSKLVAASGTEPDFGTDEFRRVLELLKARAGGRKEELAFSWAKANTTIFQSAQCSVVSLSPSDASITLAFQEIGKLVPTLGPRLKAVAQTANEVAVALWIRFGANNVLLGADLEAGTARTGWKAIVADEERPSGRAGLLKVPHHGSDDAHEPLMWEHLVAPTCMAVITPYNASSKPLPSKADVDRILKQTPHLYLSGPRPSKTTGLSPAVERLIRQVAPDFRDVTGNLGHVRFRVDSNGNNHQIELFGRAQKLSA